MVKHFELSSTTECQAHCVNTQSTVRDTENLTFSEGIHEGIPRVALRQTTGDRAANHGSSVHGCL